MSDLMCADEQVQALVQELAADVASSGACVPAHVVGCAAGLMFVAEQVAAVVSVPVELVPESVVRQVDDCLGWSPLLAVLPTVGRLPRVAAHWVQWARYMHRGESVAALVGLAALSCPQVADARRFLAGVGVTVDCGAAAQGAWFRWRRRVCGARWQDVALRQASVLCGR